MTKFDPTLTPEGTRNTNFDLAIKMSWGLVPFIGLLNSLSNNYSWVEIGVKTIEISRKPCKARQHASQGHNF